MNKVNDIYDLIIETINNNQTFTFKIHGTSMLPLFKDRTKVKLAKIDSINKNDIIFYKRKDNTYVLHRVIKVLDDYIVFAGDHQLIKETINKDACFSKVISYYKNNKELFLKGFKYNLYLFSLKFKIVRWFYIKCFK